MQQLNEYLSLVDSYLGSSQWFVYLLLGTGLFFTIYLRFPQIRYFKHALRVTTGRYEKKDDEGDTTHFQALCTALSGTVGTGNIAGVAFAIHLGGPSALFWMLVTALLGMTTKFVEVTLSHKYREKTKDGTMAGGPMYYMRNRLNLKWLAVIFAVGTLFSAFGTGSLPQINSISNSLFATFGINHIVTGAVLSVLLALVIIGGIKRIAKVASRLVPLMALIYFIGAVAVIVYNFENLIPALKSILSDVFTGTAATGGFLGASFSYAFSRGVNRGLFSNEAGQGSAPIAHASAKAHEPLAEGMVAILEPFIDTVIICMLTGLAIISSGAWSDKTENLFQDADLFILNHVSQPTNPDDCALITDYLYERSLKSENEYNFNGLLMVENGVISNPVSVIHARSVAEDVRVLQGGKLYTGLVEIENAKLAASAVGNKITFVGKSLIHSAPLTAEAFNRSFFGDFGRYIVVFGLLLFAFSTAIAWSYYGDRAAIFLFGEKAVVYYRVVFVFGFFLASFADTTIIWNISQITIVMMTVPNLIGIILLSKEMKLLTKNYWLDFRKNFPDVDIPEKTE